MVSTAGFCHGCRYSVSRRALSHWIANSDVVNFLLKVNNERYSRPNRVIWSATVVECVLMKVGKPKRGSGKHKGGSRDFRKKSRFKQ